MKIEYILAGIVALVWFDRRNRTVQGGTGSAVDRIVARENAQLMAMSGTNFTNSVWDSTSGQPSYMFGTVPVPGGVSLGTSFDPSASYVGHA